MTSNEIRASFLDFFARRGHRVVASSPLVPANDPTLLFTNAGMNQFKDTFLGRERRDYVRAASSQKCMRVSGKHNDLENVGPSLRHHTFFEMLGNFSFGDYFKADAIAFAWELLTKEWKLPADRLHATVFTGDAAVPRDQEAYDLWRAYLPIGQISELGEDNFWSMGPTGPCGRCSEVHYFRGNHLPCDKPTCLGVACDCDRYVEIWNNVFMEFDRQADGALNPLPAPSIDTGMGLERITAVLQGVLSNYDTDLFTPILAAIGDIAGARYGGSMSESDVSMRVVADHIRAAAFCIADGVVPSNEHRGYTLRMIMRRAMRHGKRLRIDGAFLHKLVRVLDREMSGAYPQLREQRDYIERLIHAEEERFESVLRFGLPRLEEALDRAAADGRALAGDEAFKLYDTLGVPREFIEDTAKVRGVPYDKAGFERAMGAQKEKARAGHTFRTAADGVSLEAATESLRGTAEQFEGYTATRVDGSTVLAVLDEHGAATEALAQGQSGYVALDRTPFYVESGGQVSDTGVIVAESGSARAVVEALEKVGADRPRLHKVRVESGTVRARDIVTAEVDETARDATRRNHTATHLLHAALRQVLGAHVKQGGSLVSPERLRFDFVHYEALTVDQLNEVERIVNEQIWRNTPVLTDVKPTDEAIAAGAMALFGEKYGNTVRVVSVPGFSMELCGGTHVRATGDIGLFTVVEEGGVAAGVRRIEATTGAGALGIHQSQRRSLETILAALKTPADQAEAAVERLAAEAKRLAKENAQLRMKVAMAGPATGAPDDDTVDAGGVKMVARRVHGLDKTALGQLADTLKNKLQSGVVVLASESDGRVSIVVSVTKDLVPRVHAGNIVRRIAPLVGGGGGGRPDFAEAGGKNPAGIDQMLAESRVVVSGMASGS